MKAFLMSQINDFLVPGGDSMFPGLSISDLSASTLSFICCVIAGYFIGVLILLGLFLTLEMFLLQGDIEIYYINKKAHSYGQR